MSLYIYVFMCIDMYIYKRHQVPPVLLTPCRGDHNKSGYTRHKTLAKYRSNTPNPGSMGGGGHHRIKTGMWHVCVCVYVIGMCMCTNIYI